MHIHKKVYDLGITSSEISYMLCNPKHLYMLCVLFFVQPCWLVPDLSELRSIPRMSVALAIDIDRCLATWAIHRCKCDEFNIDLQFLPIDSSMRFILSVCALFIYRLVVNRIGPMWPCMNMPRNMHFPTDSRSVTSGLTCRWVSSALSCALLVLQSFLGVAFRKVCEG